MAETGLSLTQQDQIHSRRFSKCSKDCIESTLKVKTADSNFNILCPTFQAILSSGTANSRHCEGTGPKTYQLKRKMCFTKQRITHPVMDDASSKGIIYAVILSLALTLLLFIVLAIYFVVLKRRQRTKIHQAPYTTQEKLTPVPENASLMPSSPRAVRAAPAPPGQRPQLPPTGFRV